MRNKQQISSKNGYIGIVVLLIMVVILGIGLSIARRSSKDIEMTVQEESSVKVFNSAETGIDQALAEILRAEMENDLDNLEDQGTNTINDSDVKYSVTQDDSLEIHLDQGVSAEVPLTGQIDGEQINIQWSKLSCPDAPAILVSAFYEEGLNSEIQARHYVYNINTGDCARGNNFEVANGTITANSGYNGSVDFTLRATDIFLRIKPIYADADITVTSTDGRIDTAQYTIISQSQSTGGDEETKAIQVTRTKATSPWFMDYAIVSGTNIEK